MRGAAPSSTPITVRSWKVDYFVGVRAMPTCMSRSCLLVAILSADALVGPFDLVHQLHLGLIGSRGGIAQVQTRAAPWPSPTRSGRIPAFPGQSCHFEQFQPRGRSGWLQLTPASGRIILMQVSLPMQAPIMDCIMVIMQVLLLMQASIMDCIICSPCRPGRYRCSDSPCSPDRSCPLDPSFPLTHHAFCHCLCMGNQGYHGSGQEQSRWKSSPFCHLLSPLKCPFKPAISPGAASSASVPLLRWSERYLLSPPLPIRGRSSSAPRRWSCWAESGG